MKKKTLRNRAPLNKRYSNLGPVSDPYADFGSWDKLGGTSGLLGNSSKDGEGFDLDGFLTSLINGGTSVLNTMYNKEDKWRANALESQLKSEKRTTTILWVVIGLVLALGVVLVVRKTK